MDIQQIMKQNILENILHIGSTRFQWLIVILNKVM